MKLILYEKYMYDITKKQYDLAKEMNVKIFPSDNPKYKIDIYDGDGLYYTSIGASDYNDYFTYLKIDKNLANERRRLFDLRTKKLVSIGSRNWFARRLLWDL